MCTNEFVLQPLLYHTSFCLANNNNIGICFIANAVLYCINLVTQGDLNPCTTDTCSPCICWNHNVLIILLYIMANSMGCCIFLWHCCYFLYLWYTLFYSCWNSFLYCLTGQCWLGRTNVLTLLSPHGWKAHHHHDQGQESKSHGHHRSLRRVLLAIFCLWQKQYVLHFNVYLLSCQHWLKNEASGHSLLKSWSGLGQQKSKLFIIL